MEMSWNRWFISFINTIENVNPWREIMIITKKHGLPENFLWGASTSAYQVEGANLSHGKGPSVQDIKTVPAGTSELDVCADFITDMQRT